MKTRNIVCSMIALAAITVSAAGVGKFMYYATRSGKTYHTLDCKVIAGKTVYNVSLEDIRKQKLQPCKKCKP